MSVPSQPEPRPGGERLAVAVLAMAAFAVSINANVMGALNPFLRDELGIDKSQQGDLVAITNGGQALSALLISPAIDAFGRRRMLVAALLVFAAASMLHLWVAGYGMLLLARGLAGIGAGVAYAAAAAMVADLVPYARRGAAMGVFAAGMYLAVPIGLPIAQQTADAGHWPVIFGVQGAAALVVAVLAFVLLPGQPGTGRVAWPFPLLRERGVTAAVLTSALHVGAFVTTIQLCSTWLDDTHLVPKSQQHWLWIVLGTAPVLGSLVLSPLSDRFGKRNFVLLTTASLAICLVALGRVSTFGWLLVVGLLLAVLAAARTGPLQALMSKLVHRDELGLLMGLRGAGMYLGIAAISWSGSRIYEHHGFQNMLYGAAGCVAIAYVLVRQFMPEER